MIWAPCELGCQPKGQYWCQGDDRCFEFREELIDDEGELFEGECGNCGHLQLFTKEEWNEISRGMDRKSERVSRSKTRYPRIEPHTGALVKSKEHELETVKAAGFHIAEHGINDAYNDELCDKLRSERLAREDRRRAIRKKKETLIREGVIKLKKRIG